MYENFFRQKKTKILLQLIGFVQGKKNHRKNEGILLISHCISVSYKSFSNADLMTKGIVAIFTGNMFENWKSSENWIFTLVVLHLHYDNVALHIGLCYQCDIRGILIQLVTTCNIVWQTLRTLNGVWKVSSPACYLSMLLWLPSSAIIVSLKSAIEKKDWPMDLAKFSVWLQNYL